MGGGGLGAVPQIGRTGVMDRKGVNRLQLLIQWDLLIKDTGTETQNLKISFISEIYVINIIIYVQIESSIP